MFSSSTQKSCWMFKDAAQLAEMRKKANSDYIKKQNVDVKYFENFFLVFILFFKRNFLTYEEEKIILLHYEYLIKQFCAHFQPPLTIISVVVS